MRVLPLTAALLVVASSSFAEAGRSRGGGGRLSSVGSGMRSGSSGSRSHSSSGGSRSRSSRGQRSYSSSSGHGHLHAAGDGFPAISLTLAGDVYAGVQKLVESDRAYSFDGRLLIDQKVGIAARFTQFQERQEMGAPLKLDLWSVAATYRLRVSDRLELDPELGIAGVGFRGDGQPMLTEVGGMAGVGVRYKVAPYTALFGAGRLFQMSGAANAIEGRAGVSVGPVQLSYRAVMFIDAGPPLEGPEVGVGFRF